MLELVNRVEQQELEFTKLISLNLIKPEKIDVFRRACRLVDYLVKVHGADKVRGCNMVPLFRKSKAEQEHFSHRIIYVSGFLSELDNSFDSWGALQDVLAPMGAQCSDWKWNSCSY